MRIGVTDMVFTSGKTQATSAHENTRVNPLAKRATILSLLRRAGLSICITQIPMVGVCDAL